MPASARVDRGEVGVDDRAAPLAVGVCDRVADRGERVVERHEVGEREEARLHDRVDLAGKPDVAGDAVGVDDVHVEALVEDLLLHLAGKVVPRVVGRVRAVQQERRAGLGEAEHVDAVEETELVTRDEVGVADEVRRVDRRVGSKRRCDTVIEPDFFESYTK